MKMIRDGDVSTSDLGGLQATQKSTEAA